MRRSLIRPLMAVSGATVLTLGGLGVGAAHAAPPDDSTAAAAVVTSASTFTMPLFGTPLTVDLTTGPGGTLSSVTLNPADGMTATTLKPNKVTFVNDAGTAKVVVKTERGSQSVEAKAGSLDDFVSGGGLGSWRGDVFGTGTATTVGYSIAKLPDGSPDITGINSSDPTAQFGTVTRETDDDGDQEAKIRVTFLSADGSQTRSLTIKVEVDLDDDGSHHAEVKVSLSKIKGVARPADQVAGAHVWTGVLCSGAPARVDYMVATDGSISNVVATPTASRLDVDDDELDVRWSEGGRVEIEVDGDDGQLKISAKDRTKCEAAPPAVNTDISTTTTVEDRDDDDDDDDDHGRRGEATSTTVADADDGTGPSTTSEVSGGGTPTTQDDDSDSNRGSDRDHRNDDDDDDDD